MRRSDGITDLMDMLIMDREGQRAIVHGVAKSQTRLSDWTERNIRWNSLYDGKYPFYFKLLDLRKLANETIYRKEYTERERLHVIFWKSTIIICFSVKSALNLFLFIHKYDKRSKHIMSWQNLEGNIWVKNLITIFHLTSHPWNTGSETTHSYQRSAMPLR